MGLVKRLIRRKIKAPVKRAVRRKVTRPARRRIELATSVRCGTCGRRYTNPLAHACTVRTDFKRRKAAAERAAKRERERQRKRAAAARKRERARERRKAAADRRKAAAAERRRKAREKRSAPRPSRPPHDFRTCQDDECRRYACVGYKAGYADAEADAERESA